MAVYPTEHVKASFPSENVLLLSMGRKPVNALNTALWCEIAAHMDVASTDDDVRVVVLASELDKAFTAGLDLTANDLHNEGADPARTALVQREYIGLLQDTVSSIERCLKPVIAAVHAVAFGAAIDLISAADIRYAAEGSIFSIKEVDVGLAADVGSLQRLPKTTGNASLLYELALTARNFDCAEALKLGLISKAVPGGREGVLKAALETAKVIASKSPIAVLGTKHLLNYSREHTTQEGLEYTRVWNMAMLQASDIGVAFQAFATKKPAKFAKLGKL